MVVLARNLTLVLGRRGLCRRLFAWRGCAVSSVGRGGGSGRGGSSSGSRGGIGEGATVARRQLRVRVSLDENPARRYQALALALGIFLVVIVILLALARNAASKDVRERRGSGHRGAALVVLDEQEDQAQHLLLVAIDNLCERARHINTTRAIRATTSSLDAP